MNTDLWREVSQVKLDTAAAVPTMFVSKGQ